MAAVFMATTVVVRSRDRFDGGTNTDRRSVNVGFRPKPSFGVPMANDCR